ncbi:MAG: PLP-dependent transferase [Micrococcales bacterium]|nr:PLP-dependent transferase [Micrococcales bacterium]
MDRATIAVAGGRPTPHADAPLNLPVEFASALAAGGDIEYARHDARNSRAFEAVLGGLEGGHAVLFASGMAAISAVLDLHAPVTLATPAVVYSGTAALLASREIIRVPLDDPTAQTRWLETPSNPHLRVYDIAAHAGMGGVTVVDSTFATPLAQRPLQLGADVIVHSVSKFLSGHSDVILGAVVCRDADLAQRFREHRELTGAIAGPMEAWLALRGVRTLDVRYRRASANAAVLAERLSTHPGVTEVVYPGLPTHPDHDLAARQMDLIPPLLAVIPRGGPQAAESVCDRVRVWTHATSLGGVESTLERRRRHRLESDLVDPALLRLSVGIEHVDDLWKDLAAALPGGEAR